MFKAIAILFTISLSAFAELKPVPVVPINCAKTAKPTDVTMMIAFPARTNGNYVEFSALLTNANCYSKAFDLKEISPDFKLYIDNAVATNSDFRYTATRIGAGNTDLNIRIAFLPDEYFSVGNQREALLTFNAFGLSTQSSEWRLIFTRNPQTKTVELKARPVRYSKVAELQAR